MNQQIILTALVAFALGAAAGGAGVYTLGTGASADGAGDAAAAAQTEPGDADQAEGSAAGGAEDAPALAPPTPSSVSAILETDADGPSLVLGPEVVEQDADFAEILALAKARGAAMTVCAQQGATTEIDDLSVVSVEGGEAVAQANGSYRCTPIELTVGGAGPADGAAPADPTAPTRVDGGL